MRRGTEPGCHRGRGGRLLQPAACAYDCADLDAGAYLDSGANAYSYGHSDTYRNCNSNTDS